jgi:hypothetical protein
MLPLPELMNLGEMLANMYCTEYEISQQAQRDLNMFKLNCISRCKIFEPDLDRRRGQPCCWPLSPCCCVGARVGPNAQTAQIGREHSHTGQVS